jgi:hypothetical protein
LQPSHSLHPCTSRQGSTVRVSAVYRRWNTRYSQRKVRLRLLHPRPELTRRLVRGPSPSHRGFYILRKSRPRNRLLVTPYSSHCTFCAPTSNARLHWIVLSRKPTVYPEVLMALQGRWHAGQIEYTSSSLYWVISWFRYQYTRNSTQHENERSWMTRVKGLG